MEEIKGKTLVLPFVMDSQHKYWKGSLNNYDRIYER